MANSASGDSATARFIKVLETFTPGRTVQSASEIGRRAGLASSTAHRIVSDLVDAGLLDRDEDRRVRVGLRLWELTTRSSRPLALRQVALPFMEEIQAEIGQHTQLVVLEGGAALCVERLSAPGAGENVTLIAVGSPYMRPHQASCSSPTQVMASGRRCSPVPLTPSVRPRSLTPGACAGCLPISVAAAMSSPQEACPPSQRAWGFPCATGPVR